MTDPCDAVEARLLEIIRETVPASLPCLSVDDEGDLPSTRCVVMCDGAKEDDKSPGHWRVQCRVEIIVEAEEEQTVAGMEAHWSAILRRLRSPGIVREMCSPAAKVHGTEDYAIARGRTKREWTRALAFAAWVTVLDAGAV